MTRPNRLPRAEAVYAWLLILNGIIGFLFMCILGFKMGLGSIWLGMPLALVGLAAGALCLKGYSAGFLIGAFFYLIQCVRYYSPDWNFGFTSGFQAGISFPLAERETLVINVA